MTSGQPVPRRLEVGRRRGDILVSVVAPALNESDNLEALYEAVREVLEGEGCKFELVIADNGSSDHSLEILEKLAAADRRVRFLALSRNFGHQGGLIAGLEHAEGDVVICMDADLQHPPATMPDLLAQWEDGYDIVNTRKRTTATTSSARRVGNRLYYWLVSKLSGIPMQDRQSDFRLMDRTALDALLALPEKNKYLRGLSYWIGFAHTTIPYDLGSRHSGKSRYLLSDLIRFGADGLLSFSMLPLRLFIYVGLVVSLGSLLYVIFILLLWVSGIEVEFPPGWTSLALGIYFIGGVQLIGIGILGEYLGRVYDETRARPPYVLRRPPSGQPAAGRPPEGGEKQG